MSKKPEKIRRRKSNDEIVKELESQLSGNRKALSEVSDLVVKAVGNETEWAKLRLAYLKVMEQVKPASPRKLPKSVEKLLGAMDSKEAEKIRASLLQAKESVKDET